MKKITTTLLFSAFILSLSACTVRAPIENIAPTKVTNNVSHQAPTRPNIEQAILRAGSGIGWKMTPVSPGLILANLNVNGQTAIAKIYYTKTTYQIKYKDSENLDFNGAEISPTYNEWINNLNNAIQNNLHSL